MNTNSTPTTAPTIQDKMDAAAMQTLKAAAILFRRHPDLGREGVIARIAEETGTGADMVEAMIDRAQMIQAEAVNG